MKCHIFTSRRVLSAVGMVCLATIARAQSTSFSAATPTASFGETFYETVALPRFDPALGRLNSISLRLDAVGTTAGWGLNVVNGFLFQVHDYGLVSGSLRLLRPDYSELVFLGHASPWTLLGVLPPASTTPVFIQVPDSTATMLLTSPGDLSLFTGTDTVTLPVDGFGYPYMSPNSLEIVSATPQTGFARVTVTYDFTAIPEPSSIAWLALATPGVARLVQRRFGKPRREAFAIPAGSG